MQGFGRCPFPHIHVPRSIILTYYNEPSKRSGILQCVEFASDYLIIVETGFLISEVIRWCAIFSWQEKARWRLQEKISRLLGEGKKKVCFCFVCVLI